MRRRTRWSRFGALRGCQARREMAKPCVPGAPAASDTLSLNNACLAFQSPECLHQAEDRSVAGVLHPVRRGHWEHLHPAALLVGYLHPDGLHRRWVHAHHRADGLLHRMRARAAIGHGPSGVRRRLHDRLAGLALHGQGTGPCAHRPDGLRAQRGGHGV